MRGGTSIKKELVPVGGRPIIWHVMRIFAAHNFNDFVLTLGYGGEQLRRYFLDYDLMERDLRLSVGRNSGSPSFAAPPTDVDWRVTLADTGLYTEKAQRVAKVAHHLNSAERFWLGYGDDVSDVDLTALYDFHCSHGKMATITGVQVDLQYGVVEADASGAVSGFVERPQLPFWINGGYMLFERAALPLFERFENLETELLPHLAAQNELMLYRHDGFWQSMNTLKDTLLLEKIWQENPPWKIW